MCIAAKERKGTNLPAQSSRLTSKKIEKNAEHKESEDKFDEMELPFSDVDCFCEFEPTPQTSGSDPV